MSVRVVIVDDHEVFRDGLRAVLDGRGGVQITGDHGGADEAIEAVPQELPDVVLMDLHMPGLDGVAATRVLRERFPEVRILVLSMLDDRPSVTAALEAGADGYVTKSASLEEILTAVHAAARGQLVLGADVAQYLRTRRPASEPEGFTLRERQLLPLLANGWSTERMAARLDIAEKTVRNYLSALYLKLGATDRTTAALAARALLAPGD